MTTEHNQYSTITRNQRRFASWMTDVLIYTVVLNLFVEYFDAIVIDSFTISLFTAVLLKFLLDILTGVEHRVKVWFAQKEGTAWNVLGTLSLLGILFISKFVILEVVDIVFGDHVELGKFVHVVALVITLIAARMGMRWLYEKLGSEPLP